MPEATLFHLLDPPAWAAARAAGRHAPPSLATDGFLHCCTAGQLPFVLARHFPGRTDMLALEFRPDACDAPLDWVRSEPGQPPFPHLRGPIPLDAVVAVSPLSPPRPATES